MDINNGFIIQHGAYVYSQEESYTQLRLSFPITFSNISSVVCTRLASSPSNYIFTIAEINLSNFLIVQTQPGTSSYRYITCGY